MYDNTEVLGEAEDLVREVDALLEPGLNTISNNNNNNNNSYNNNTIRIIIIIIIIIERPM